MVWAARSGTRVFTPLSSTIAFSSTRIPKTRSQAHGSLNIAHPIIEPVSFLCSNIVTNSNGVYLRPVQSIAVFSVIGLYEFRRRLTGLHHPLKATVIPYIIRG